MTVASIYPHYVAKIEKKGRTKQELHQVIEWLTGINESTLKKYLSEEITFELFFQHAKLHPNAHKITGIICGKRIEDIEDELTKKVRYLDKLIDELAKGKSLDVICRE
jgi:hypothetical protein